MVLLLPDGLEDRQSEGPELSIRAGMCRFRPDLGIKM